MVGVATDYLNAKLATVYISQENLEQDFNVTSNVLVLANAKPDAAKPAVKAALGRLVRRLPAVHVVRLRRIQGDTVRHLLADVRGVRRAHRHVRAANASRVAEHAGDQRLGAHSRDRDAPGRGDDTQPDSGMVVAEALLLAAVGVLFGIVGGVAMGYALVYALNATMYVMPYYFPWGGIVVATIAGFTFALLAAIIPSRTAAKLDIVTALHYE